MRLVKPKRLGVQYRESLISSLKLFSASDKLWRAITAYGAEAKFNDYVARGAIEKMPARKAIKDEISKLVSSREDERCT